MPQLVDDENESFRRAIELLQTGLMPRLDNFPDSTDRTRIMNLLEADAEALTNEFGSLTAAWDFLVDLKYHTSLPDSRQRKCDAWFMELIEHSELFIRDVIRVAVLHLGRSLIKRELVACLDDPTLKVFRASPKQLTRFATTAEVLADTVTGYMDRDARNTTQFAVQFGDALGAPLFDFNASGLSRGMIFRLPYGETIEDAWKSLLDVRHAIIHSTGGNFRNGQPVDLDEWLYELDLEQLQLIVDMLGAFCFGFATRMMVRLAEKSAKADKDTADSLRRLLSGELRVLLKRLLTEKRYGLAWAIAEVAIAAEPSDSPGIMLHLNAFLARRGMGARFLDREKVEAYDVGDLPRYRIIKLVLLEELDQSRLEPLLDEALATGDMSMAELTEWPALSDLRTTRWFREWLQRYDEGAN